MNFPLESIQYLGLISIIVIVLLGAFILREDNTDHQSISAHGSSSNKQTILLGLALIIASMPLYVWFYAWLLPTYQLSVRVAYLLGLTYIAQFFVVLFPLKPEKGKRYYKNSIHLIAGSTIAVSIICLLSALLFSHQLTIMPISFSIVLLDAAYSAIVLLLYLVSRRRKHFLCFEIIYILLFALSIGAVSI